MIELTQKAVEKLKEFAEAEGVPLSLRISVKGGSCAGFVNEIEFNEVATDNDEVIEQDGIKLLVDQLSLQYLDGTIIDYKELEFGGGFSFNSPLSTGSCGCGKSNSY